MYHLHNYRLSLLAVVFFVVLVNATTTGPSSCSDCVANKSKCHMEYVNISLTKYECQCSSGYYGDGTTTCTKPDVLYKLVMNLNETWRYSFMQPTSVEYRDISVPMENATRHILKTKYPETFVAASFDNIQYGTVGPVLVIGLMFNDNTASQIPTMQEVFDTINASLIETQSQCLFASIGVHCTSVDVTVYNCSYCVNGSTCFFGENFRRYCDCPPGYYGDGIKPCKKADYYHKLVVTTTLKNSYINKHGNWSQSIKTALTKIYSAAFPNRFIEAKVDSFGWVTPKPVTIIIMFNLGHGKVSLVDVEETLINSYKNRSSDCQIGAVHVKCGSASVHISNCSNCMKNTKCSTQSIAGVSGFAFECKCPSGAYGDGFTNCTKAAKSMMVHVAFGGSLWNAHSLYSMLIRKKLYSALSAIYNSVKVVGGATQGMPKNGYVYLSLEVFFGSSPTGTYPTEQQVKTTVENLITKSDSSNCSMASVGPVVCDSVEVTGPCSVNNAIDSIYLHYESWINTLIPIIDSTNDKTTFNTKFCNESRSAVYGIFDEVTNSLLNCAPDTRMEMVKIKALYDSFCGRPGKSEMLNCLWKLVPTTLRCATPPDGYSFLVPVGYLGLNMTLDFMDFSSPFSASYTPFNQTALLSALGDMMTGANRFCSSSMMSINTFDMIANLPRCLHIAMNESTCINHFIPPAAAQLLDGFPPEAFKPVTELACMAIPEPTLLRNNDPKCMLNAAKKQLSCIVDYVSLNLASLKKLAEVLAANPDSTDELFCINQNSVVKNLLAEFDKCSVETNKICPLIPPKLKLVDVIDSMCTATNRSGRWVCILTEMIRIYNCTISSSAGELVPVLYELLKIISDEISNDNVVTAILNGNYSTISHLNAKIMSKMCPMINIMNKANVTGRLVNCVLNAGKGPCPFMDVGRKIMNLIVPLMGADINSLQNIALQIPTECSYVQNATGPCEMGSAISCINRRIASWVQTIIPIIQAADGATLNRTLCSDKRRDILIMFDSIIPCVRNCSANITNEIRSINSLYNNWCSRRDANVSLNCLWEFVPKVLKCAMPRAGYNFLVEFGNLSANAASIIGPSIITGNPSTNTSQLLRLVAEGVKAYKQLCDSSWSVALFNMTAKLPNCFYKVMNESTCLTSDIVPIPSRELQIFKMVTPDIIKPFTEMSCMAVPEPTMFTDLNLTSLMNANREFLSCILGKMRGKVASFKFHAKQLIADPQKFESELCSSSQSYFTKDLIDTIDSCSAKANGVFYLVPPKFKMSQLIKNMCTDTVWSGRWVCFVKEIIEVFNCTMSSSSAAELVPMLYHLVRGMSDILNDPAVINMITNPTIPNPSLTLTTIQNLMNLTCPIMRLLNKTNFGGKLVGCVMNGESSSCPMFELIPKLLRMYIPNISQATFSIPLDSCSQVSACSMCHKDAQCNGDDQCICKPTFYGDGISSCSQADEIFDLQLSILSSWSASLQDPNSNKHKSMVANLLYEISVIFNSYPGWNYIGGTVKELRQGSVIVGMEVAFSNNVPSMDDITSAISNYTKSANGCSLGSLGPIMCDVNVTHSDSTTTEEATTTTVDTSNSASSSSVSSTTVDTSTSASTETTSPTDSSTSSSSVSSTMVDTSTSSSTETTSPTDSSTSSSTVTSTTVDTSTSASTEMTSPTESSPTDSSTVSSSSHATTSGMTGQPDTSGPCEMGRAISCINRRIASWVQTIIPIIQAADGATLNRTLCSDKRRDILIMFDSIIPCVRNCSANITNEIRSIKSLYNNWCSRRDANVSLNCLWEFVPKVLKCAMPRAGYNFLVEFGNLSANAASIIGPSIITGNPSTNTSQLLRLVAEGVKAYKQLCDSSWSVALFNMTAKLPNCFYKVMNESTCLTSDIVPIPSRELQIFKMVTPDIIKPFTEMSCMAVPEPTMFTDLNLTSLMNANRKFLSCILGKMRGKVASFKFHAKQLIADPQKFESELCSSSQSYFTKDLIDTIDSCSAKANGVFYLVPPKFKISQLIKNMCTDTVWSGRWVCFVKEIIEVFNCTMSSSSAAELVPMLYHLVRGISEILNDPAVINMITNPTIPNPSLTLTTIQNLMNLTCPIMRLLNKTNFGGKLVGCVMNGESSSCPMFELIPKLLRMYIPNISQATFSIPLDSCSQVSACSMCHKDAQCNGDDQCICKPTFYGDGISSCSQADEVFDLQLSILSSWSASLQDPNSNKHKSMVANLLYEISVIFNSYPGWSYIGGTVKELRQGSVIVGMEVAFSNIVPSMDDITSAISNYTKSANGCSLGSLGPIMCDVNVTHSDSTTTEEATTTTVDTSNSASSSSVSSTTVDTSTSASTETTSPTDSSTSSFSVSSTTVDTSTSVSTETTSPTDSSTSSSSVTSTTVDTSTSASTETTSPTDSSTSSFSVSSTTVDTSTSASTETTSPTDSSTSSSSVSSTTVDTSTSASTETTSPTDSSTSSSTDTSTTVDTSTSASTETTSPTDSSTSSFSVSSTTVDTSTSASTETTSPTDSSTSSSTDTSTTVDTSTSASTETTSPTDSSTSSSTDTSTTVDTSTSASTETTSPTDSSTSSSSVSSTTVDTSTSASTETTSPTDSSTSSSSVSSTTVDTSTSASTETTSPTDSSTSSSTDTSTTVDTSTSASTEMTSPTESSPTDSSTVSSSSHATTSGMTGQPDTSGPCEMGRAISCINRRISGWVQTIIPIIQAADGATLNRTLCSDKRRDILIMFDSIIPCVRNCSANITNEIRSIKSLYNNWCSRRDANVSLNCLWEFVPKVLKCAMPRAGYNFLVEFGNLSANAASIIGPSIITGKPSTNTSQLLRLVAEGVKAYKQLCDSSWSVALFNMTAKLPNCFYKVMNESTCLTSDIVPIPSRELQIFKMVTPDIIKPFTEMSCMAVPEPTMFTDLNLTSLMNANRKFLSCILGKMRGKVASFKFHAKQLIADPQKFESELCSSSQSYFTKDLIDTIDSCSAKANGVFYLVPPKFKMSQLIKNMCTDTVWSGRWVCFVREIIEVFNCTMSSSSAAELVPMLYHLVRGLSDILNDPAVINMITNPTIPNPSLTLTTIQNLMNLTCPIMRLLNKTNFGGKLVGCVMNGESSSCPMFELIPKLLRMYIPNISQATFSIPLDSCSQVSACSMCHKDAQCNGDDQCICKPTFYGDGISSCSQADEIFDLRLSILSSWSASLQDPNSYKHKSMVANLLYEISVIFNSYPGWSYIGGTVKELRQGSVIVGMQVAFSNIVPSMDDITSAISNYTKSANGCSLGSLGPIMCDVNVTHSDSTTTEEATTTTVDTSNSASSSSVSSTTVDTSTSASTETTSPTDSSTSSFSVSSTTVDTSTSVSTETTSPTDSSTSSSSVTSTTVDTSTSARTETTSPTDSSTSSSSVTSTTVDASTSASTETTSPTDSSTSSSSVTSTTVDASTSASTETTSPTDSSTSSSSVTSTTVDTSTSARTETTSPTDSSTSSSIDTSTTVDTSTSASTETTSPTDSSTSSSIDTSTTVDTSTSVSTETTSPTDSSTSSLTVSSTMIDASSSASTETTSPTDSSTSSSTVRPTTSADVSTTSQSVHGNCNQCHSDANCISSQLGVICQCRDMYAGDGVNSCKKVRTSLTLQFTLDLGWIVQYANLNTTESIKLKLELEKAVKAYYQAEMRALGFEAALVTMFSKSSVLVHMALLFDETRVNPALLPTLSDIEETFMKAVRQPNGQCLLDGHDVQCDSTKVYDRDECADPTLNQCAVNAHCINTPGSYECRCNDGYYGSDPETSCTDVNECDRINACDGNSVCQNTIGSYTCTCKAGYEGDGKPPNTCNKKILFPECRYYRRLKGDDRFSWRYYVPSVKLGYKTHRYLRVNTNGFIVFGDNLRRMRGTSKPVSFEDFNLKMGLVAPFWTDLDFPYSSRNSTVTYCSYYFSSYYKRYRDVYYKNRPDYHAVYDAAQNIVRSHGQDVSQDESSDFKNFEPRWVFIVNWNNGIPYPSEYYKDIEDASFQTILIADKNHTFSLFNYQPGQINLDVDKYWRQIAIGYADKSYTGYEVYHENSMSLTPEALDIDKVTGNTGVIGQWLYKVSADTSGFDEYTVRCNEWYEDEREMSEILARFDSPDTCPCSFWQARRDRRFSWYSWYWMGRDSEGDYSYRFCFISRFSRFIALDSYSENTGRRKIRYFYRRESCCYLHKWINGNETLASLITSAPYSGSMIFSYRRDRKAQMDCCIKSSNCDLYHSLRRVTTCEKYEPPIEGWALGDPHIRTLDGVHYTFNGIGQYVMLETFDLSPKQADLVITSNTTQSDIGNDNKVADSKFVIQTLLEKASTDGNNTVEATIFTGFAMKSNDSDTIQVMLSANRMSMEVTINSTIKMTLDEMTTNSTDYNKVSLEKTENETIVAAFENGFSVEVILGYKLLTIGVSAPRQYQGHVRGLLGFWNGDKADDFRKSDGQTLPASSTERQLFDFGTSWRIKQISDSLFTDLPKAFDEYYDANFKPLFLDEYEDKLLELFHNNSELLRSSNATCTGSSNYMACMYDSAQMASPKAGSSASSSENNFQKQMEELGNFPPTFKNTTLKVIELKPNVTVTIQLEVTDPNENQSISLILDGNVTSEVTLKNNELTILKTNDVPITIDVVAIDNLGASSTYQPEIKYCDCRNNGTCDYGNSNRETRPDRFYVATCDCAGGWGGEHCEIDPCMVEPKRCFKGVSCTVVNGTAKCGQCPDSHRGDGIKCYDIDECVETPNICEENCHNVEFGYRCECTSPGKIVSALNKSLCVDFDECETGTHNCTDIEKCRNTIGAYACDCLPGRSRNLAGKCIDVNECGLDRLNDCHRDATCVNIPGSYKCECKSGYYGNGTHCEDIDECEITRLNNCSQLCNNVVGGFNCSCYQGFDLGADNRTCIVKDGSKCTNTSKCNQDCYKQGGADTCTCRSGYMLMNGSVCVDINECNDTTHKCSQICHNSDGGYTCSCRTGFKMEADKRSCSNIDECSLTPYPCAAGDLSVCTDTDGSYACQCKPGYQGDGKSCEDVDECQTGTICPAKATCINKPGNFTCKCPAGYQVQGIACTEIKSNLRFEASILLIATWDNRLSDVNSIERVQLEEKIVSGIDSIYKERYPETYQTASITSITQGSIKVMLTLFFDTSGITTGNLPTLIGTSYTLLGATQKLSTSCYLPNIGVVACNVPVTDFNECGSPSTFHCSADTMCKNTNGAYECVCLPGYDTVTNKTVDNTTIPQCQDIDECLNWCKLPRSVCKNTPGSYQCTCETGFTSPNPNTTECKNDPCANWKCLNGGECILDNAGGYTCRCLSGFQGPHCENGQDVDSTQTVIIAVCAGCGGVLLIVAIVILVVKCKKKSAKKVKPEDEIHENTGTVIHNFPSRERDSIASVSQLTLFEGSSHSRRTSLTRHDEEPSDDSQFGLYSKNLLARLPQVAEGD
ncbi:uncharacterized protein LOC141904116 [Tubulanus polymorphus]|uniref:uncharacterized protein LOC141904116 n=1 Tax=Tubulanus polymorphus TaxID=672921 RepID=UPI003DA55BFE